MFTKFYKILKCNQNFLQAVSFMEEIVAKGNIKVVSFES